MKDYDHFIIWLDYFNKNLSRKKGRRIKKENAIYDPTFSELYEAAVEEGFDMTSENSNDHARFPRRSYVRSGYVMVPKDLNKKKSDIIDSLTSRIVSQRNKLKRTK
jgi:signal recognition particle subunit SRP19